MKTTDISRKVKHNGKKDCIKIDDVILEVTNNAADILLASAIVGDDFEFPLSQFPELVNLLLGDEGFEKLRKLNLTIESYLIVIIEALNIATSNLEAKKNELAKIEDMT